MSPIATLEAAVELLECGRTQQAALLIQDAICKLAALEEARRIEIETLRRELHVLRAAKPPERRPSSGLDLSWIRAIGTKAQRPGPAKPRPVRSALPDRGSQPAGGTGTTPARRELCRHLRERPDLCREAGAILGIPADRIRAVAEGRSTLAPSAWRRLWTGLDRHLNGTDDEPPPRAA